MFSLGLGNNMIKIIDRPSSGKTKKLIEYCAKENAALVCGNPDAMMVKAHSYGMDIKAISYLDFLQTSEYNLNNAYLDDIDEFLKYIGCNVKGFAGNIEE